MARSKRNKQTNQTGKKAAKKLKEAVSGGGPVDIEELLDKMTKQDEAEEMSGSKKRVPKEDLSDDEMADGKEDEDDEAEARAVEAIMKANIDDGTKHGYRLHLVRLVRFLYSQQQQKKGKKKAKGKKSSNDSSSGILHPELVLALDSAVAEKSTDKQLRETIYQHVLKASPDYHPIDLAKLEVPTFIAYLLNLTKSDRSAAPAAPASSDKKEEQEFMKSYGGHRSALTYLFTECDITPSKQFQQRMKQAMSGLKNTAAKCRGEKGSKLGAGKEPLPFDVYRAICKALVKDKDTQAAFAHCFLTITWNLMCRSRNTVNIIIEHMGFSGDSMTVQFAHTKTDRGGTRSFKKRHM